VKRRLARRQQHTERQATVGELAHEFGENKHEKEKKNPKTMNYK